MRTRKRLCALSVALLSLNACGGSSSPTNDPSSGGGNLPGGDGDNGDVVDVPAKPSKSAAEIFSAQCMAGLERAKAALPGILAAEGDRTEESFLEPMNVLIADLSESGGMSELMKEVHPDPLIREAATACDEKVSEFGSELSRNQELFAAYSAVDTGALDANGKRLVEHNLRDFRRAGVDKDAATRARLKEIDAAITKLSNDFSKNVNEDVRSVKLNPDELAGMPEDWIAAHPVGKDGLVSVTTDYPDYIPFSTYAESTDRRKELYIAFRSRGDKTNEKILKEVLALRSEMAGLLGYKNYADYATEDKMAKSAKNAQQFIDRVIKSASKKAKADYKELLDYKKKNMDKSARWVQDFEKGYIENKLQATKYKFDSQEIRKYYPYNKVRQGLLDITATIYGLRYEPAKDAALWHSDVESFDVFDAASNEKLGRIYLDMHPREGKYKHAAQFPFRSGVKGIRLPEGALVCNFPSGDSLMEQDDVETMFHEFGHLMHHVLGGHQKWIDQSGVATEWDFVEAPSQMFEEWATSYQTLSLFAKNAEGEVIPKELVAAMRKAKTFGTGTFTLQQMFYASLALKLHMADPATLDIKKTVVDLQSKITPFPFVEGTSFEASFGHLMGYSSNYYTYMWSLVIAKDMLTPFKKATLMDAKLTAKYRDTILVPGGTKDAADLVKDFLGRDFNYKAFEAYLAGK